MTIKAECSTCGVYLSRIARGEPCPNCDDASRGSFWRSIDVDSVNPGTLMVTLDGDDRIEQFFISSREAERLIQLLEDEK